MWCWFRLEFKTFMKFPDQEKSPQGSKKPLSGRPGQVDFPFGQETFSAYLSHG